MLPLWVQVTKDGLETRIVFHGEWMFTNHLPQEVQVRACLVLICFIDGILQFPQTVKFFSCC